MNVQPIKVKGEPCHNGCMAKSDNTTFGYFRSATHTALMLGRVTHLCGPCAKRWPEIYADALEGP